MSLSNVLAQQTYLHANVTASTNSSPPTADGGLDDDWNEWTASEKVEMVYQMLFFAIGTPINAVALSRFSRSTPSSSTNKSRLIRLSRQLLFTHLMVLMVYCVWRTYWLYSIVWTMGNAMCKIFSFLAVFPFHLWSNIVVSIAVDMLFCVVSPLKSVQNGHRRVSWLIGASWALAILCSAPMLVFRGTVHVDGRDGVYQCQALDKVYGEEAILFFHFSHVLTTFYIPLAVILLCYLAIGLSLKYQFKKRSALEGPKSSGCGLSGKQQNTTHRFLVATACIICSFVLTWLPYQILSLLQVICDVDSKCEEFTLQFSWLQAILIASTCVNPFLYRFGIFKSTPRRMTITGGGVGGIGTKDGVNIYFGVVTNNSDSGGRMSIRSLAGLSTTISSNLSSLRLVGKRSSLHPDGKKKHSRDIVVQQLQRGHEVVTLKENNRRASTCSSSVVTTTATRSSHHRLPPPSRVLVSMTMSGDGGLRRDTNTAAPAVSIANGGRNLSVEVADTNEHGKLLAGKVMQ